MCLLAGDWNFMEVEEGRFKTDGTWGAGDRGQSDAFAQCCGSWAELFQPDPTRRDVFDGKVRGVARLDRIYTSLSAPVLNDLLVTVSTVGHAVKCFAPSDHIPVVASISTRVPAPSPTQIPKWIAQHELFHSLCSGAILEIAPSLTPLEKLARVKEIFWQSVPLFKYRLKLRPPKSTCEKLHFALMAFRGWRMGVFSQCVRAIRVYPLLLQFI